MGAVNNDLHEISGLVKRLELLSGKKVSLRKGLNKPKLEKSKGKVGRPKKISNPLLSLVVHKVLYKAIYEEMIIKGNARPLTISRACDLLARENMSRRNPELGALRFLIVDKSEGRALTKNEVVARCARSIRRLYYLGREKSKEDPLIKSKIQGIFDATRADLVNAIKR